jgi:hypothetical protein
MLRSVANHGAGSLVFPGEGALQSLQPLLLIDGRFYVAGPGGGIPGVALVSALGVVHPYRVLCDARVVLAHAARINVDLLRERLQRECTAKRSLSAMDPLMFFIDVMVPGLAERDVGGSFRCETSSGESSDGIRAPSASSMDLEDALRGAPVPVLHSPSLWVLGRAWRLVRATVISASIHVTCGADLLSMTGEYSNLKALRQEWDGAVSDYCDSVASVLCAEKATALPVGFEVAQRALAMSGVFSNGDILYLGSRPARVGYVVPAHYNHTLGRRADRDLALTAPLGFPPAIPQNSDLLIYQRGESNRWEPMPRSVCLGVSPSVPAGEGLAAAGVNLLAFLRFGAVRIAANGRFHEHDGRED